MMKEKIEFDQQKREKKNQSDEIHAQAHRMVGIKKRLNKISSSS